MCFGHHRCWASSDAAAAEDGSGGPAVAAAEAATAAFNSAVGLIDNSSYVPSSAVPVAPTLEDFERVRAQAALVDPSLALPSVPEWTYAFARSGAAPFASPASPYAATTAGAPASSVLPLGRLHVRVVCCVNLPAMNSYLGTSDAFVTLHCGLSTQRTRTVLNSLNPRFDSAHVFDVCHARDDATLTLKIIDWDQLGKNRDIAYVQVPLADLCHSRRVLKWIDIEHLSVTAAKAANMRGMQRAQAKEELKRKDRSALEQGHAHDDASGSTAADDVSVSSLEVRVAKPRIQLELQYLYSDAGLASTLLLPSLGQAPHPSAAAASGAVLPKATFHPEPSFDIDVLYSDLFRLLKLLQPVTSSLAAIGPLLFWQTPWQSLLALVAWVCVCQRPWLFMVLLELVILGALARSLVRRLWSDSARVSDEYVRVRREAAAARHLALRKRDNAIFRQAHNLRNLLTGREDDAPAAVNAEAQGVLGRLHGLVNPFHTDSSGRPLDAQSQSHLNGLVTHTLNGMLISFGLRGSLVYYQLMLTGWCDMLERTTDLLTWKNRGTTMWIAIGVGVLLLYSLFLPQRYIFLVAGAYVLTMFTPPSQAALAAIFGALQLRAAQAIKTQPPKFEGFGATRAAAAAAASSN